MTAKLIPCSVFLVALSVGCHTRLVEAQQDLPVLSLCNVIDNWKTYHGQRVRLHAILSVGPEMTWLHDPACRNGEGLTDVKIRDDAVGAVKKLDGLLNKEGKAWVVLEGVFHGPEVLTDIDPRIPPGIREKLEKSTRRYGHMGAFQSMIDVTRVVEAKRVL